MKNVFILIFILTSLSAKCTIDPAPEHAKFELDSTIIKLGAYISLINNQTDSAHDRTHIIRSDIDDYYFMFPGEKFKIKIKFNDSTEKYSSLIYNKSRYSVFYIKLNSEKNLTISDITNQVKNYVLLKFLFFSFLLFVIIKTLPTWAIIFPKDILAFVKYYGSVQLIYSLLFSLLIFYFHGIGMLLSVIGLLLALYIDKKILTGIYLNTKKAGRISISIVLSTALTILFCLLMTFAFILII